MSREQKRMAALFLCLLGIMGTIAAMKERQPEPGMESGTAAESMVQTQ